MLRVDRGEFWGSVGPNGERIVNPESYLDKPQEINCNVVISAPCLHAHVLELASEKLAPGGKVLDVGSGTGILCAGFYEMVKSSSSTGARVVGIEHMDALVEESRMNLSKSYSKPLSDGSIKLVCGDGRLGWPEEAPYDIIHVGAGCQQVPNALLEQLKVGGKLIIPIGPKDSQFIQEVVKVDEKGNFVNQPTLGVRYVDLTSKEH